MVLHLVLGDTPLFSVPEYELVHFSELGFYVILGVIGGLVSVAFVKILLKIRQRFLDMPQRTRWLQPVAGGLTVGVLGFIFGPEVLGVGYARVGDALNSGMGRAGNGDAGRLEGDSDGHLLRVRKRGRNLRPQPLHRGDARRDRRQCGELPASELHS